MHEFRDVDVLGEALVPLEADPGGAGRVTTLIDASEVLDDTIVVGGQGTDRAENLLERA